jgi:hypothetical protein
VQELENVKMEKIGAKRCNNVVLALMTLKEVTSGDGIDRTKLVENLKYTNTTWKNSASRSWQDTDRVLTYHWALKS